MRINYWQSEGWPDQIGSCECPGLSLVEAKRLLREKGGVAFTAFFDRDWNLIEKRKIELKGNNSTKVRHPKSGNGNTETAA
jgi:hypothetical protein